MKTVPLFLITLLLTVSLLLPNAPAQNYITWSLPDGAVARLGKGSITGNVAFSPDGTRLAVASSIGIWIYDARPGKEKELDLFTGHTGEVTALAFSPDGATIASANWDGTLYLWNAVTGEQLFTLEGHKGWVSAAAFSPNLDTIASGSYDGTILLWKLR
jgi:WD40 repeat protein